MKHVVWAILRKELLDILRDTRALMTVGLVTILAGPLVLLFVTNLLSDFESKSERRIVMIDGMQNSPALVNYLQRETAKIVPAPPNYAVALVHGQLGDPVLTIPQNFDQEWMQGNPVQLTLLVNSTNSRAQAGVPRLKRWIQGFASQQTEWYLMQQGIAPHMGELLTLNEVDQATDQAQTSKLFGMLPYFLVFATLYGVWGAAIETSVGEREGRTFEGLLMTPISLTNLIFGKWLAVSLLGMLFCCSAILCFLPAQALIGSDTLRAMFNFDAHSVLICWVLMCPLTGFFAAILMWVGWIAQTPRQAQANATLIMLATAFFPMLFSHGADHTWYVYMPVLSQHSLVLSMLNGDPLTLRMLAQSIGGCMLGAFIFLYLMQQRLSRRYSR